MKITSKFLAVLAISAAFTSALTAGITVSRDSDIKDFAINSVDGSCFHFGVHAEGGTRAMEYNGTEMDVDVSRYVAFLGYDISRSMTLFVTMGTMVSESDSDAIFALNTEDNN